jgi:hypothetical protein
MSYETHGLIGRGGMGVVYRATDTALRREVALKLITPELAADVRFRERFLQESQLAASLDHPHVVPVYASGEIDGQLFLAMRLVEAGDLRQLLPLAPERALALLGQIASALDAAHAHGLVHRDVKPANILVDADDHAYLTDFGISKQLGGVTTDTGRLVGSLDYLAPEQIAGDPVDARTDQYALACVLYECLAGTPAFRRDSEAETLWAHMRAEFAPLRGRDHVFRRAFARDPRRRYASCRELIEAARAPRRRHRGRIVAGIAAAALLALAVRDGPAGRPGASAVLTLAADGTVDAFVEAVTVPSNLAVGEGAVWVIDSESESVARIASGAATRFRAGPRPVDIAAGAGAVWVATGAGASDPITTTAVARVDPRSLRVTATANLSRTPSRYGPVASEGFPLLAVGAGAVWAIGVDNRIYRIDPASGHVVARIKVDARVHTLAAGAEGVWFLNWSDTTVTRIDPATNRIAERIPIRSDGLAGIAVGGGSVWVTSPGDGRLWRIDHGRARAIDVGGALFVSYRDGVVWTGNFQDGVLSRVDARTNAVTRRVSIEGLQALAAGAGTAWVSVAGRAHRGALPAAVCGGIESGGTPPDVLIASDFPLQGAGAETTRGLADAVRWVLKDHGFRAGRFTVGYQSCDAATAQTGGYENRRCAANATAYTRVPQVVAVIGPWVSFCAQHMIPALNRAPGGPLALVSPSNTDPGLTRGSTALYPTGVRNYARVIPRADVQGAALALFAQRLRLRRVYLLSSPQADSMASITAPFRRTAQRLHVGIAGAGSYPVETRGHAAVADAAARARPDGIVIDGGLYTGGGELIRALRARLGADVAILVGDQFAVPDVLKIAGRSAHGVHVARSEALPDAGSLTVAGARFAEHFGTAARRGMAMNAAEAAEVVLAAIARSDGTRASVLRSLQGLRVHDGILGSFTFDRGDIAPASVTVLRITGNTPPGVVLPIDLDGAVVERVIEVSAALSG